MEKKLLHQSIISHIYLYYEKFTWIHEAIAREKEVKDWRREKKIELIKTINPNLDFLNDLFV
jgi:putative endonuclease